MRSSLYFFGLNQCIYLIETSTLDYTPTLIFVIGILANTQISTLDCISYLD